MEFLLSRSFALPVTITVESSSEKEGKKDKMKMCFIGKVRLCVACLIRPSLVTTRFANVITSSKSCKSCVNVPGNLFSPLTVSAWISLAGCGDASGFMRAIMQSTRVEVGKH